MKILLIHNQYGKYSGEEAVVDAQIKLLRKRGVTVKTYFRSSEEIPRMKFGQFRAFFSGFYGQEAAAAARRNANENRLGRSPDDAIP